MRVLQASRGQHTPVVFGDTNEWQMNKSVETRTEDDQPVSDCPHSLKISKIPRDLAYEGTRTLTWLRVRVPSWSVLFYNLLILLKIVLFQSMSPRFPNQNGKSIRKSSVFLSVSNKDPTSISTEPMSESILLADVPQRRFPLITSAPDGRLNRT